MITSKAITSASNQGIVKSYCSQTFGVSGREVVNNYVCGQKTFSTASLWNILRQKKR